MASPGFASGAMITMRIFSLSVKKERIKSNILSSLSTNAERSIAKISISRSEK